MNRCFFCRVTIATSIILAVLAASGVAGAEDAEKTLAEKNRANLVKALRQPAELDFDEVALDEVLEFLSEMHGVPFWLDGAALDKLGIGPDTPVTSQASGDTLAKTIKDMLASMNPELRPMIYAEMVLITTKDEAKKLAREKEPVYPEPDSEETKRLIKVLAEPTQMDFEDIPLDEVLEYLEELHEVTFVWDSDSLVPTDISTDTGVTARFEGISLASALRLTLRQLDPALRFSIQDDAILIEYREEPTAGSPDRD